MDCLAPRAPGDSVRPRRQAGASVRPLNFTVRRRRMFLGNPHVRIANRLLRGVVAVVLSILVALVAVLLIGLPLRIWGKSVVSRPAAIPDDWMDQVFFLVTMIMVQFGGVLCLLLVCWLTVVFYRRLSRP